MSRQYRWKQIDHERGIYIVGFGEFVKIGWSATIGRRLRYLEEGLPERLHLYRILPCRPMQDERRLHRYFREYRKNGEWFALSGTLKDFVGSAPFSADMLTDGGGASLYGTCAALDAEPYGPQTLYQRYLDLAAQGGGVFTSP